MTRYFVLGTTTETDTPYDGCASGLVAIDDDLLALIKVRHDTLQSTHKQDNQLCSVAYHSRRVHFFDEDELDPGLLLEDPNTLVDLFNDHQFGEINEELFNRVLGEFREAETEMDVMVIHDVGVSWRASPKHSAVAVETAIIPFDILFKREAK